MRHRLNLATLTLCSTIVSAQETTALTGVQNPPTGAIIGSVIGGILVLTIVIGSTLWYLRRKRDQHSIKGRPIYNSRSSSQLSVRRRRRCRCRCRCKSKSKSRRASLESSSSTPPPGSVPLGPNTTANQPITNLSERALHRTIENERIYLPPAYLPAPRSPDRFPGGSLSSAPSNLLRYLYDPPSIQHTRARPVGGPKCSCKNLTDGDVRVIARRLMEMQRDQRS